MSTTESATFASAAGDVTARAWAPERIVPVQGVELRCDLPHTCPECGTTWESKTPAKNGSTPGAGRAETEAGQTGSDSRDTGSS